MARKIRDGAMYLYLNGILLLLCRDYFNVNTWLEKRIAIFLVIVTAVWYFVQALLTDNENDAEKKLNKHQNSQIKE